MKIDPVSILLNDNFRIDKKIYFISGNEKTLMQKIKATQPLLEACNMQAQASVGERRAA